MALVISETHVNATEHYRYEATPPYESFADTKGELFRELQRDYGRCLGKVYVDTKDGELHMVGWCFRRTDYYTDTGEPFAHEVWITIHGDTNGAEEWRCWR